MSKYIKLDDAINAYNQAVKELVEAEMNEFDLCHFTECSFNTTQIMLIAQRIESLPTIEANEDCISRKDAMEALDRIGSLDTEADRKYAKDIFDSIPPITPTERHTGAWIEDGYYGYPYYVCSNCGQECGTQNNGVEIEPLCTKHCPNCGAKMEK